MESYNPNSAKAQMDYWRAVDEAEVREANSWTADAIRDHHADLLEAEAQRPGTMHSTYQELMAKAQIARADAQAIRLGEQLSTPIPPTF